MARLVNFFRHLYLRLASRRFLRGLRVSGIKALTPGRAQKATRCEGASRDGEKKLTRPPFVIQKATSSKQVLNPGEDYRAASARDTLPSRRVCVRGERGGEEEAMRMKRKRRDEEEEEEAATHITVRAFLYTRVTSALRNGCERRDGRHCGRDTADFAANKN